MQPRKAERSRSLLRAHLVFNSDASMVECVVRNLSPAGARIQLPDVLPLPAEFDIRLAQRGRVYRCRIAWRGDDVVGVEFVGVPDEEPRSRAKSADETDADRADRVMRENAALRVQLLKLKQRIAQLTGEA